MARIEAGVVVVGAGVVGVSTALWLQQLGHDVVIIERTTPGDGASGHNGGVFSLINCLPIGTKSNLLALPHLAFGSTGAFTMDLRHVPKLRAWGWKLMRSSGDQSVRHIAASLAPLLHDAIAAYQEILEPEQLAQITDGGLIYGNRTAEAYNAGAWSRELQQSVGMEFETVDATRLQELLPKVAATYAKGTYVPHAPYVHSPLEFNRAMADLFVERGGRVVAAQVQSFVLENGRVVGVQTTIDVVRGKQVVLAAGAWSQQLSDQLGVRCLLDTERGYGYEFEDFDSGLTAPLIDVDNHVALTPRGGGLRIVGVSEIAGLVAPPKEASFARVRTSALQIFPELDFSQAERWMSYRPSTPDSMPYIGALPQHPNVIAAFGHGHVGFTMGASTGRVVAEQITNAAPSIDIAPFAPDRFTPRRKRSA